MNFGINYDKGYVVGVSCAIGDGGVCFHPLRKFASESDAKDFRYIDCPRLDYSQIVILTKHYKDDVYYKRVNSKRFIKISKV